MPSERRTATTHPGPRGPLVFNTRALSRSPGSERTETRVALAPAGLQAGMAGIPEGAEVALRVRLESVTEGVLVNLSATAPLTGECARCLEPVARSIDVSCQELFRYSQDGGDGGTAGYSLDGDLLDLEPALRDALVLALPLAPRCQDDCPGLCVECGARLAQVGTGHRHDDTTDPRWAQLRQFKAQAGPDGAPVPETSEENGRGCP
ncbi:MAG TPA: DUF177 domain-containing protein [Streptosporangiaceae bacterium]|nr:DUF177 domain-containing protein [Streptosporangiaceae bacterium]